MVSYPWCRDKNNIHPKILFWQVNNICKSAWNNGWHLLYHIIVNHAANKTHLILASKVVPGRWDVERSTLSILSALSRSSKNGNCTDHMRIINVSILKKIHLAEENSEWEVKDHKSSLWNQLDLCSKSDSTLYWLLPWARYLPSLSFCLLTGKMGKIILTVRKFDED